MTTSSRSVRCLKPRPLPGTLSTYSLLSFSHFVAHGRPSQEHVPRLLTVMHVLPVSSKVTEMCHTLKEFQEMGELSNTSLNARIWSFLKMTILCFASCCFLILINLIDLAVVVAAFWLSVFASIFASVSWLFLPCSQSQFFLPFWPCDNETASTTTALGTINLCKCTQHKQDLLIAFLNGTGICAQVTPLIAFLSRMEVGATPHQLRTRSARLVASH